MIDELRRKDGITRVGVVGYSLGGNLAVKLAGEVVDWPDSPCPRRRRRQPDDRSRALRRRHRARVEHPVSLQLRPATPRPDASEGPRVARRLRSRAARSHLDDPAIRRRLHGAASRLRRARATTTTARARCASCRRIRIPTLILAAADDPFVPAEQFARSGARGESARHSARRTARRPLRLRRRRARRPATGTGRRRRRSPFFARRADSAGSRSGHASPVQLADELPARTRGPFLRPRA